MKKQFHKIKIAAENLSRSNRTENKNDELVKIEKQVEKYKDVLEKIHKKFSSAGSDQDQEKRIKKVHEYRLGQALEESAKDLPLDLVLFHVLTKCGDLEKIIASHIIENEIQTENEVTKRLKTILDTDWQEIQGHRRKVSNYVTEYSYIKKNYESALRSNENFAKINQLKQEQEECEAKLEKERDCYAAQMFELIAKDEIIAYSVRDYVRSQKNYYEKSLRNMTKILEEIDEIVDSCQKKRIFGVPLHDHLKSTNREISSVIELCCCCLIERGLQEEGLLRVGCAGTKLKRMKNAIDAHYANAPLPAEYQDNHVIASTLKWYLRELPDPLLTHKLYTEFIQAAQRQTESERRSGIKNAVNKLPKENYDNLKYLTKFLWLLYKKHEQNKMSSQNIAIVMSPNILWPPDSLANDYMGQVNSSAAVNTIVELLVSDWDFFFNGADVQFFQTLSRDNLFSDNNINCNSIINNNNSNISNSINNYSVSSSYVAESVEPNIQHQTHSRSSSHDTSRILFNETDSTIIGRSQSNDSISDTSPSNNGSPKLPQRKKKSAPTPPSNVFNNKINTKGQNGYQPHSLQYEKSEPAANKCDGASQTPTVMLTGEKLSRPEKPPRPVNPVECHTLNRSTYKNRSIDSKPPSQAQKPVAMPRTIMSTSVTKSIENLTSLDDINSVMLREKPEIREKPIIPERPITFMRPTSFRTDNHFNSDSLKQHEQHQNQSSTPTNGSTTLKKASSFRVVSTQQGGNGSPNSSVKLNSNLANSTSSLNSNSKTTLERAQFYNVDKQQVSIINVSEPNTATTNTVSTKLVRPTKLFDNVAKETKEFIQMESDLNSAGSLTTPTSGVVPISPRGGANIKRPQVPAPPPPTTVNNRRKSDGTLADSTNL